MSKPEKSEFRKKIDEFFGRSPPSSGPPRGSRDPRGSMNKTTINIWYIVAALAGFTLIQSYYQASKQYTTIPYSRFEKLLDEDKIDKVWVEQNSIEPRGICAKERFFLRHGDAQPHQRQHA